MPNARAKYTTNHTNLKRTSFCFLRYRNNNITMIPIITTNGMFLAILIHNGLWLLCHSLWFNEHNIILKPADITITDCKALLRAL